MSGDDDYDVITVCTEDNKEFTVLKKHLRLSKTIVNIMEDGAFGVIPLPNITSSVFENIIRYLMLLEKNILPVGRAHTDLDLLGWEQHYMDSITLDMVREILLAANYLDCPTLLDCCTRYVAKVITDCKTAPIMRETLGIINDFEPGEEETIRKQNIWQDPVE